MTSCLLIISNWKALAHPKAWLCLLRPLPQVFRLITKPDLLKQSRLGPASKAPPPPVAQLPSADGPISPSSQCRREQG